MLHLCVLLRLSSLQAKPNPVPTPRAEDTASDVGRPNPARLCLLWDPPQVQQGRKLVHMHIWVVQTKQLAPGAAALWLRPQA